jgi:hypothetical protein
MRDKLGNKIVRGDKLFLLTPTQCTLDVIEVMEGGLSLVTGGGQRTVTMPKVKVQMIWELEVDPALLAKGAEGQLFHVIKIHNSEAQLARDELDSGGKVQ